MTMGLRGGTRECLFDDLREVLSEPLSDVRKREQALFAEVMAQPSRPIVLFGAGNLGRRTLSLLRGRGIAVAAFTDNNPDLWGGLIEGVQVLSPADASSRFAGDGLAVVTIWRGEGGHDFCVTRDGLRKLGWRRVESFIPLFWGLAADALPYITIDLPSKVIEAKDRVLAASALWSDYRSLRDYVAQIRWRITGDFTALSPVDHHQYFAEDVLHVRPDEVFIDCGAFNGDTLLEVLQRAGSWRLYHAFEPDPASYAALQAVVKALPATLAERVCLHPAAVADCRRAARFSATGTEAASLSLAGECQVDCLSIDEVCTEPLPTFIKMDVEGAEAAALAGSSGVIRDSHPLLAVAAYHKQADLWELPHLIHTLGADYRLFLRLHGGEGFKTVLYAVSPERLVGKQASGGV
jgi:FkbM family methyltransferase